MRSSWWTGFAHTLSGLTIGYGLVVSGLVDPSWGVVALTGVFTIAALLIGVEREERKRGNDEHS